MLYKYDQSCLITGCPEPATCELTYRWSTRPRWCGPPQVLCVEHLGAITRDFARHGGGPDGDTVTVTIRPVGGGS